MLTAMRWGNVGWGLVLLWGVSLVGGCDGGALLGQRLHRLGQHGRTVHGPAQVQVRARGIGIPILPGIMPMHNFRQAKGFVTRAGTTVPSWLDAKFDGLDDDPETRKLVAAAVVAGQVQKLAKHGVENFHFYTMNRADLVFAICHLLGIRPAGAQQAA